MIIGTAGHIDHGKTALVKALTGVDVSGIARDLSGEIDDAIWNAIGREEADIRADPRATRDPILIGTLGAA